MLTFILIVFGFLFITHVIGCVYVANKVYNDSGFFMALGFFVLSFCLTPFLGNWMHKNTNDPPGFDKFLNGHFDEFD